MSELSYKAPKSTDTMERVGTLIHKLLEQYEQQAHTGRLLMTAQMLLAELQQYQSAAANGHTSEKVSVMIPVAPVAAAVNDISSVPAPEPPVDPVVNLEQTTVTANEPVAVPEHVTELPLPKEVPVTVVMPEPVPIAVQPVQPAEETPVTVLQPATPAPAVVEPVKAPVTPVPEPVAQEAASIADLCPEPQQPTPQKNWAFDPVFEVPTLAHQDVPGKGELNESMASNGESLNERLRVEKIELGNMLQGSPIRDLKKAIGINDRYHFINELFRGDETMYERSLKTINGFSILPEAEYWIQRELKVKLGWSESSESVHHFDQLVRRRFS